MRLYPFGCCSLAALFAALGCSGSDRAPDWEPGSPEDIVATASQAQATESSLESAGATAAGTAVTRAQIADWGLWMANCGNDEVPARSPDDVMAALPKEERAAAIYSVLMEEPLSTPRVEGLVQLLKATEDPRAVAYLSDVFDAARDIAERHVRVNMGSDPLERAPFTDNMTRRNRIAPVKAVADTPGAEAEALLQRAAGDSDEAVRVVAEAALGSRIE